MKKIPLIVRALLSAHAIVPALAQTPSANALPEGGQVVAGDATIETSGNRMNIHQSSDRAAIDWRRFDVGSDGHVEFVQPSTSSVALNRVTGSDASRIFGRITANGQVFLSNPNGVYFSPTASVNVGGLVATTHAISVEDFMAGRATFERQGAVGSVVNEGELNAALGGYVALLAPEVRNQGVILANLGTVALAAGETFELQFGANNTLANLRVTPSTIRALVDNRSAVLAPGGLIILSAQAVDRVQGGVVRNSGHIEATALAQRDGRIVLEASDRIENLGRVEASGSIRVDAPQILNEGTMRAAAGEIAIAAGDFLQTPSGLLDVAGESIGGTVRIEASGTVDLRGAIEASATGDAPSSRGGTVEVRAPQITLQAIRVDVSGFDAGDVLIDASASAPAPGTPAPLPSPSPERLALLGSTQLQARGRRGRGGSLTLLGKDIELDGAALQATGATGGGTVRVGGGWQGGGGLRQASTVAMSADTSIDVSAIALGDGGTVVLWSDVHDAQGRTDARGSVVAHGGASGGDGGKVETSGHEVDVDGLRVDAGAAQGEGGLWLIDPYDYTIGAPAAAAIVATLNAGTSVTVTTTVSNTTQGGSTNVADVGNIVVNSAIAKTAGGNATLTLQANRRITLNAPISSTSNRLNVVLWSDYGNTNLAGVSIQAGGAITTNGGHVWIGGSATAGGSLVWNGLTVGDGASVGSVSSNFNAIDLYADINTGGGDALLWAGTGVTGVFTGPGIGVTGSRAINAGAGNVTLLTNKVFTASISGGTLAVNSTGKLAFAPGIGNAFDALFEWVGSIGLGNLTLNNTLGAALTINNASSLGGISIGEYAGLSLGGITQLVGNTANVLITTALNVAGPISIRGNDILLAAGLTTTGLRTGDIALKAAGSITQIGAIPVATNGSNVVYWADIDGNTDGGIALNATLLAQGTRITTNGGGIWMGGGAGTTTWVPYAGAAPVTVGSGEAWGATSVGLNLDGGTVLDAGAGNVWLAARSKATNADWRIGVRLSDAAITGRDVVLRGIGGAGNALTGGHWGVSLEAGSTLNATGQVDIVGQGGGTTSLVGDLFGVLVDDSTIATTTGALNITGTAGSNNTAGNHGVVVRGGATLSTASGALNITGIGSTGSTSTDYDGIAFGAGTNRVFTGSGTLTLTGTEGVGSGSDGISFNGAFSTTTIGAVNQTGNIVVNASDFAFTNANSAQFLGTGTLTLAPLSTSTSFSSTVDLTSPSIGSGFTGLVVGKAGNLANLTLGRAISVAGPIALQAGTINIGASLTSSATGDILIKSLSSANPGINLTGNILKTGGARSTLTLQANGRITLQSLVQATNTALDTVFWSDFDNSNNDGGLTLTGNVTTNGGHFWAGGSSTASGSLTWNGLNVGDGASVGSTSFNLNALDLTGSIATSGGDILLWAGAGAGAGIGGIVSNGTGSLNAGAGNLTLIAKETSGLLQARTTGTLSIAPDSGSFASGFNWTGTGTTDLTLTTGPYANLRVMGIASLGGLAIGSYSGLLAGGTPVSFANSSNVTIGSALSLPWDPLESTCRHASLSIL